MKKAFISILGNNNYLECRHSYAGVTTDIPVKYCQEDMLKIFCQDFDDNSEIRIFLTEDARKKNWLDNGHKNKDNNIILNRGLKNRLEDLKIPSLIKEIPIKEGFDEKEIWEIFNIIFESFREGEEVIVDVTHSFRSLPLLMITLLNYAKQVKKIRVLGIYYAAFESVGSIEQIKNIPVEERIVPILNLTSFSELQDWTNATYDFVNNANVNKMKVLVRSVAAKSNIENPVIRFFPARTIEKLEELVNDIALCRGDELIKFDYTTLRSEFKQLRSDEISKPFNHLTEIIHSKIALFQQKPENLVITLAEWCLTHNLIQQAITLIQEFTITLILEKNNLKRAAEQYRNLVSQTFRIYSQKISEPEWKTPASDNKDLVYKFLNDDLIQKLSPSFSSLTELRNDVNHAGFLVTARSSKSIKDRLKNILEDYKKYLS
jgi:CRISPR-associated Csx2 family protein